MPNFNILRSLNDIKFIYAIFITGQSIPMVFSDQVQCIKAPKIFKSSGQAKNSPKNAKNRGEIPSLDILRNLVEIKYIDAIFITSESAPMAFCD